MPTFAEYGLIAVQIASGFFHESPRLWFECFATAVVYLFLGSLASAFIFQCETTSVSLYSVRLLFCAHHRCHPTTQPHACHPTVVNAAFAFELPPSHPPVFFKWGFINIKEMKAWGGVARMQQLGVSRFSRVLTYVVAYHRSALLPLQ